MMLGPGFVGRRAAPAETNDLSDSESPSRRDPIRWLVVCGILLIAAIVAMPDGLAGGMKRLASRLDFRRP